MRKPVKEIAKNRWPGILSTLGIEKQFLSNKHGPCPICDGKDRYRFDDKGDGRWFCNQCGSGDGVELVKRVLNVDFKEAARRIEEAANGAPIAIRRGPDVAKVKASMNELWTQGRSLAALPATVAWWRARIGEVPDCVDLRAIRSMSCPGEGEFAGMIALVRDADGKPVNLHRTFMTATGEKAAIGDPRRVMPVPLPKGSAVRLGSYETVLGIAEGIETAAAVSKLFQVPCWAALNAGNLEGWLPPADVRVIVFGDNDLSYTGQAAAYALGKRLRREKRDVDVRIPAQPGWDWNDVFLSAGKVTIANDGVAA